MYGMGHVSPVLPTRVTDPHAMDIRQLLACDRAGGIGKKKMMRWSCIASHTHTHTRHAPSQPEMPRMTTDTSEMIQPVVLFVDAESVSAGVCSSKLYDRLALPLRQ